MLANACGSNAAIFVNECSAILSNNAGALIPAVA